MTLAAIATGARPTVARQALAADRALATEVQQALTTMGLLDGTPDGKFGPVSNWALDAFLAERRPGAAALTREVAQALVEAVPWPLRPGADLAGRVIRAMQAQGHSIARHPDCVNIVYVEGMDPGGTLNGNAPNAFNDLRMVIQCDPAGVPVARSWEATTEPGRRFTEAPLSAKGAARIAFGQFKAWSVGPHGSDHHEALVQVDEIPVHRDLNRDYRREGDPIDPGMHGINQHWGYDYPRQDIRDASAGCLVGRLRMGHIEFMALVKSDSRFQASSGYRFQTTILDGRRVA